MTSPAAPRARKSRSAPKPAEAPPAELRPDASNTAPVETAEAHGVCANCQAVLAGPYCHACGQKGHLHSRLKHLLEEFVEGIAHFDGRFWRTLPLLAFNPGALSRRWREGQRVRYIAPLHVFLFAMFLLFVVPSFFGQHLVRLPSQAEIGGPIDAEAAGAQIKAQVQREVAAQPDAPPIPEISAKDEALLGAAVAKFNSVMRDNQYYGYRIENLAYKLSWTVVPISMAILWLLMLFKGFTLYDHAVVTLYGLGALSLAIAVTRLFPASVGDAVAPLLALLAPAHAVAHLRGAYGLSWTGAALRGAALGTLSLIGFSLFLAGVIALGVYG